MTSGRLMEARVSTKRSVVGLNQWRKDGAGLTLIATTTLPGDEAA